MAYTIYKADGTAVTIPDNVITTSYYDPTGGSAGRGIGIQLLGALVPNYGQPIAQTLLQMTENFASAPANFPSDSIALQGQLWFCKTSPTAGDLFVRSTSNSSGGLANWKKILTTDSGGDISAVNIVATSVTAGDFYGGTFHGIATSATYADLAERYAADAKYEFGTVVVIGGEKEITQSTKNNDTNVFGVISKNPAFMMNKDAGTDDTHPYVAMSGRVPVRVLGPVEKGQRLVSSDVPGVAMGAGEDYNINAVIGRALENYSGNGISLIEATVGAK